MNKELIKKEFQLGSKPLKEWLRENMDIDTLVLSGTMTDSDYAILSEIDIMGDYIGLTSLDMGKCQSNICLWSCYPRSANSKLKQLILPNGIKSIHTTFEWCENVLEEVVLPDTLLIIGGFSFSYANLKTINLPENIMEIDYCAFLANPLTTVYIPNSCTNIEAGAFAGCDLLQSFEIDDSHPSFSVIEGSLYSKDGSTLIQPACARREFKIAEGTKIIEDGAFAYCKPLSIYFPRSIEEIDESEFEMMYEPFDIYIYESFLSLFEKIEFEADSVTFHILS